MVDKTWELLVFSFFFLFISFLAYKVLILIVRDSTNLGSRFSSGGGVGSARHRWVFSSLVLNFPLHCNVCETLLLTGEGQYCSNCGIGSCNETPCLRSALQNIPCKELSVADDDEVEEERRNGAKKFKHSWVKGNLPINSVCVVCDEVCGSGPGILDLRCPWCQNTVHTDCLSKLGEVCHFGDYRRFIIPPFCIRRSEKNVIKITKPRHFETSKSSWSPLIVLGNKKSGNNDCGSLLSAFRGVLNPLQVVDLDEYKPEDGLKLAKLIEEEEATCIVLVAGGDGTVGWVINTIHQMNFKKIPSIAICPLGTGNDLARSIGFGGGATLSDGIETIMLQLKTFTNGKLDLWNASIRPLHKKRLRFLSSSKMQEHKIMNYFSIGIDALVTYKFHKTRESPFYLFSSRLFNKFIYFGYGTKDLLERECKNLDKVLEVFLDGQKVDLPSLESLVVLNTPCWGGGARPWQIGENYPEASIEDKKLEVFCIYSSFHIFQLQVGLAEPHRLGQASEIVIRLNGKAPVQIDGEPWVQKPSEIKITHCHQIPILRRPNTVAQ